jgi:hypothetical protein
MWPGRVLMRYVSGTWATLTCDSRYVHVIDRTSSLLTCFIYRRFSDR